MKGYRVGSVQVNFTRGQLPVERELSTARRWATELSESLEALGNKYAEANAAPHLETERGESRQLLLAASVQAVTKALRKMPRFTTNPGMVPLHDLLGALLDLHAGKLSPILEPRDVTASPTTISSGFLRRHAILCVKIMEMAGLRETPACKHVAGVMRKLGYVGRKKGPFPMSTLTDWVAVLSPHDNRFLNKRIVEIRADKGDVLDRRDAERLVEAYLGDPLMLSKRLTLSKR